MALLAAGPARCQTRPAKTPTGVIQQHFDTAQKAQREGDLLRSESEYRQALGVALEQLGEAYHTMGDLDKAETAYRGATEASADAETALLGLAVVYLRKGEFQKGVETVRTLLAQKPMHAPARQLLGKLYFSMSRFDAAALELQEAQRLAPEDTETAITLAFTYLRQRELEKAQKIFSRLLEQHGDSPQIHIMIGAAYRETEYVNQAVAEFKRAVALNADYLRLHYYMALTYLSQEGSHAIPQALAELEDEIRRHPNEYSAYYLTGLIYVQQRKLEEAVPYLEKAATLDATIPDAPLYLGQALYLLGRTDRAVPLLQKAVELTKDPSRNHYQVAKAHYLLGQFFNRQGKAEEAKQHLALAESYKAKAAVQDQQSLQIYLGGGMGGRDDLKSAVSNMEGRAVIIAPEPPTPEERRKLEKAKKFYSEVAGNAYNQLGLLHAAQSDFRRATQYLDQAARWDPEIPDLYFNLGLAQFKSQDYAPAAAALEKARARQPGRTDIQVLLGLSDFFIENYRQAVEVLSPLGKRGVEDPQMQYALGLSLAKSGERGAGIQILRALVAKYPQVADAHLALGQALALDGAYASAAAEFSRALELDPNVPDAHYYAGLAVLRQARFADAATEFRQEIARRPEHARAHYHLGLALVSLERLDEGTLELAEAIRLNPRYADAHYELGKARLKQGKIDAALPELEEAAQLDSGKSYIQYQLSQAYLKTGRTDAAQAALARYRELKALERSTAPHTSSDTNR